MSLTPLDQISGSIYLPIREGPSPRSWPTWVPDKSVPTHQQCQTITDGGCCTTFAKYLVVFDQYHRQRVCLYHATLYSAPIKEFNRDYRW